MGKSPTSSPTSERLLRARLARLTRTALLAERRYETACRQRADVNDRLAEPRRLWQAERDRQRMAS
jgi:hypothetical protein